MTTWTCLPIVSFLAPLLQEFNLSLPNLAANWSVDEFGRLGAEGWRAAGSLPSLGIARGEQYANEPASLPCPSTICAGMCAPACGCAIVSICWHRGGLGQPSMLCSVHLMVPAAAAHCFLHIAFDPDVPASFSSSSAPADVYERLTPAGRRPGFRTLVATQLVSGVWHGLFPGYWLFFATSAVMFEAGKTLYR